MNDDVDVTTIEDGIVQLRLARPPVNALTPPFLDGIAEVLAGLAGDTGPRAVILTGSGTALSAGMDLKQAVGFDRGQQTAMVDALNRCYAAAYEFPKPLIAAANGHAIAGGLFFVLAADYRVVSATALFGLTEVRVGIAFPVVANAIACHELGAGNARRVMLSGANVTGTEARSMGFVDEAVAAAEVGQRGLDAARRYAALPPRAYAAVKAQIRAPVVTGYRDALAEGDPARDAWFSDETRNAAETLLAAGR